MINQIRPTPNRHVGTKAKKIVYNQRKNWLSVKNQDIFADFGGVLEVRINHSHTNNPNFGFVIFADPKSVTDVLHVMVSKL